MNDSDDKSRADKLKDAAATAAATVKPQVDKVIAQAENLASKIKGANPMSYKDKRVVVTGCFSGVGEALVHLLDDLGAEEIIGLDIKEPSCPVSKFIQCDMGDPDSIDAAAAEIGGPVHVLFNNAGIAGNLGVVNVMKVNVFGLLRLTKALEDHIPEGGAVINTASIAGMNWPAHQMEIMDLLSIDDWDKQVSWVEEKPEVVGEDSYMFSKECVQVLTMMRAKDLIRRKVRIASACPAPIDTPLLPDFKATMSAEVIDWTAAQATGEYVTPQEVANLLAYLGSDAASYISGTNVNIDGGFAGGTITGQVDFSTIPGA